MASRQIIWTKKANYERKEILQYWINRNKSKTFSYKLNQLFIKTIQKISETPTIGKKTNFENVYVKIVRDYLLFYEFNEKQIKILAIWDGRRDETKFNLK